MYVRLVMNCLHYWNWISLNDGHRYLDKVYNWYFHNFLNWYWVFNREFDHFLYGNLHDFLNWIRHGLVDFHMLDFDDWHWYVLDDWNLDRVGMRYWNFNGLRERNGHRLWYPMGHFTKYLVRLLLNVVLGGCSVVVSQTVDFIDNWGFDSHKWSIAANRSAKSGATDTCKSSVATKPTVT